MSGKTFAFQIDANRKAKILKGLDAIGETLQVAQDISTYEARAPSARPWLGAA